MFSTYLRFLLYTLTHVHCIYDGVVWFMVFNTTFNNILLIWCTGRKTTDLLQVTDKLLSHKVASSTPGVQTHNFRSDRQR